MITNEELAADEMLCEKATMSTETKQEPISDDRLAELIRGWTPGSSFSRTQADIVSVLLAELERRAAERKAVENAKMEAELKDAVGGVPHARS